MAYIHIYTQRKGRDAILTPIENYKTLLEFVFIYLRRYEKAF